MLQEILALQTIVCTELHELHCCALALLPHQSHQCCHRWEPFPTIFHHFHFGSHDGMQIWRPKLCWRPVVLDQGPSRSSSCPVEHQSMTMRNEVISGSTRQFPAWMKLEGLMEIEKTLKSPSNCYAYALSHTSDSIVEEFSQQVRFL